MEGVKDAGTARPDPSLSNKLAAQGTNKSAFPGQPWMAHNGGTNEGVTISGIMRRVLSRELEQDTDFEREAGAARRWPQEAGSAGPRTVRRVPADSHGGHQTHRLISEDSMGSDLCERPSEEQARDCRTQHFHLNIIME